MPRVQKEKGVAAYDGTGRLESDSGTLTEVFGFDAEGNIQSDQIP
jgi:hypothetical protein